MGGIIMPYMGDMGQMGYVQPNTIPNLSIWYNASASTTVVNGTSTNNFDVTVSNGTLIGTWNDLSGGSHPSNVRGGSGNKPSYATPIQNGLGAILYSSASKNNLDINPIAWAQNLSGLTVYVLSRPTSFPSGSIFPLTVTDTSLGMWWNGTNWTIGQSSGNYGTVTVTNDTTKFHMYGFIYDGTATGNANRLQFRYDRSGKTLTFTGTIGANTASPAYFYFGGDDQNTGTFKNTYMDGYMAEVLIWTRALTAVELTSVELYLNTKWGLGY